MEQNIPDEVMREVEEILEERFKDYNKRLGFCHIYWAHKKELLSQRGYTWLSPADLEPDTMFDQLCFYALLLALFYYCKQDDKPGYVVG